jgi:hypothetical protein
MTTERFKVDAAASTIPEGVGTVNAKDDVVILKGI